LINPISGKGEAKIVWERILPILSKGHLDLFLIETKYSSHAVDIINEIKPGEYDAIITISGDGLLHEVINTIYNHPLKD